MDVFIFNLLKPQASAYTSMRATIGASTLDSTSPRITFYRRDIRAVKITLHLRSYTPILMNHHDETF
jgi:hypothetical protein